MFEIENEIQQITKAQDHIKKYSVENLTIYHIKEKSLFSFQENNNKLGDISPRELLKYSTITADTDNIFNVDLDTKKISIIEKYICNTFKINDVFYVEYNSPEKSLFMSNVELLISLSKELVFCEEQYVKKQNNIKVIEIVDNMIYNLYDLILNLLYSLTYKKTKDGNYLLSKYMGAIITKVNHRILNDMREKMKQTMDINTATAKLNECSKILEQKMDTLNKNFTHQTDAIEILINKNISENSKFTESTHSNTEK